MSDTPPDAAPPCVRCPRCGGATAPRKRKDTWNPFLTKKVPDQVTCVDCGLDFEPPTETARDSGRDTRDSGRSPWSRP